MSTFDELKLSNPLRNAIEELGFETPTPIQSQSFAVIRSGKDVVGIAQTGTGKTLAFMMPLLMDVKYSKDIHPKILVMAPTRELVLQIAERIEEFAKYINVRVLPIYGGTNINTQKRALADGADIIVATPGRLYDLALNGNVQLKAIKKLVIDEVDVMLDLGFRFQLNNIFELLPEKRQNIMFSATMTEEVDALIDSFFRFPQKIAIAISGTPLDNILQECYAVQNFYTKVNLLKDLIHDKEKYRKVLVFVSNKRSADRLFEALDEDFGNELCVIHSNKTQNYRMRSIEQFDKGVNRILVSTDVMARGIDLDRISHVINFDTPFYPENYMHRIGRTGRAEQKGNSLLFYTEKETAAKERIEELMDYSIPENEFPDGIEIAQQLTPEERPRDAESYVPNQAIDERGPGFHEKKEKNKKVNLGGSYQREIAKKYKKPKTRGDKTYHKRNRTKKKK
ncbi:MAG: DEAD/DEAH box helicase [Flavobacteriales bacterium]|jgi:ATP-dependent RNA helicase RhlE|nr:DEAD/DEAH box helicase [Flavobacteriales bacterium]